MKLHSSKHFWHPNTARLTLVLVPLMLAYYSLSVLAAGAIYKSIDKDGNVVFTDQPLEGAENLSGDQPPPAEAGVDPEEAAANKGSAFDVSVAPEPKNPPKSDYKEPEEPKKNIAVSVVEILTPIHDATLQDPVGLIWVELQSYPTSLKETGLTAELWMNDQLVNSGKRPMLSIQPPERGTHTLLVKLVDENGQLFLQSEPVNIHVKYQVSAK